MSPESAEIMAKLGFGVLVIMQNEWPKAAEDIQRYRKIAQSVGRWTSTKSSSAPRGLTPDNASVPTTDGARTLE